MATTPYIGELNQRIAIYRITNSPNAIGEHKAIEELVFNAWAGMEDISGTNDEQGKIIHLVNRIYTIRFRKNFNTIAEEKFLVHENERLRIKHIKQIGRKEYLQLICVSDETYS